MKTETLRFRTTPEMKTALNEQADTEDTTLTELIEKALHAYMMEHNQEYRLNAIASEMHNRLCECDDKTCTLTTEIYDWLYNGDAANLSMEDVTDLMNEWNEYNGN